MYDGLHVGNGRVKLIICYVGLSGQHGHYGSMWLQFKVSISTDWSTLASDFICYERDGERVIVA